jgi:hypothetical protein
LNVTVLQLADKTTERISRFGWPGLGTCLCRHFIHHIFNTSHGDTPIESTVSCLSSTIKTKGRSNCPERHGTQGKIDDPFQRIVPMKTGFSLFESVRGEL